LSTEEMRHACSLMSAVAASTIASRSRSIEAVPLVVPEPRAASAVVLSVWMMTNPPVNTERQSLSAVTIALISAVLMWSLSTRDEAGSPSYGFVRVGVCPSAYGGAVRPWGGARAWVWR